MGAILSTLDQRVTSGGARCGLTAEARVARPGRSIIFVEAKVTTPSDELSVQGMVTHKINIRPK
ncbi:MAG: hypothetical protein AB7P69_24150 [Candidatus Binatia bacterium]